MHFSIRRVWEALRGIGTANSEQYQLLRETEYFLDDLRGGASRNDLMSMGLMDYLEQVQQRCDMISGMIDDAFFNSVTVTLSGQDKERLIMQIPQQQQKHK